MKNAISTKVTSLLVFAILALILVPGKTTFAQLNIDRQKASELKQYYQEPFKKGGCVYTMLKPEFSFLSDSEATLGYAILGGMIFMYNEANNGESLGVITKVNGSYVLLTIKKEGLDKVFSGELTEDEMMAEVHSTTLSRNEVPSRFVAVNW